MRSFAIGNEARPLRFLLLCVGGWPVLRVAAHWNPDMPPPPDAVAPPWVCPDPICRDQLVVGARRACSLGGRAAIAADDFSALCSHPGWKRDQR